MSDAIKMRHTYDDEAITIDSSEVRDFVGDIDTSVNTNPNFSDNLATELGVVLHSKIFSWHVRGVGYVMSCHNQ